MPGQSLPRVTGLIRSGSTQLTEDGRMTRETANTYAQDKPISRVVEAVNSYEGTDDIHVLGLGPAQTGLKAFA
ncbi:MAG: hypothetical protein AAFV87_01170 [Pseudomonadota bacterium]